MITDSFASLNCVGEGTYTILYAQYDLTARRYPGGLVGYCPFQTISSSCNFTADPSNACANQLTAPWHWNNLQAGLHNAVSSTIALLVFRYSSHLCNIMILFVSSHSILPTQLFSLLRQVPIPSLNSFKLMDSGHLNFFICNCNSNPI